MAEFDVNIVAVERKVWSGKATFIFTRTTAGEIGIYARHIPLVAELVDDAMVRVVRPDDDDLRLAVHGGFLSITEDEGVTILAEAVDFAAEIDEATARHDSQASDPKLAAQGRARLRALGLID